MNRTMKKMTRNNAPLRWFTVVKEGEDITGEGGEGGKRRGSLLGLLLAGVSVVFLFLDSDIPLGSLTPLSTQMS